MFGQLGEIKQMYEKYKKLQETLKNIVIRSKEEHSNPEIKVSIDITWEMKVRDVMIDCDDDVISPHLRSILSKLIQASFEKGQSKAQQVAMEKTKEILGFDPNDLAGMMGWGGMGAMGWGMPKLW
jgi:DNA-binding protein YbaB